MSFEGLGLVTNHPFDVAYQAARAFSDALHQRSTTAGFMKNLLLQRICSSFASGRATAERLRQREALDDEEASLQMGAILQQMTPEEASHLDTIVDELARPEARDPKISAVKYFLTEHPSDEKTWLEHGCIIFSQYYDTVRALAGVLATALPGEVVAIYAGAGKSGIHKDGEFASVERGRHQDRGCVAMKSACSSRPTPPAKGSTCRPSAR